MSRSVLWQRIDETGARDVSIVGISKHAGKTTALGRLIADAAEAGLRLGIASIGLDGERADSLLGIPKPSVWVPEGTLFATAIGVHRPDHAPIRWLEPIGVSSPLGEVWLGQTLAEGTIELAGVCQLAHLQALRERFHQLGAVHVLFDGALSRLIAVSPQVADAVLLAAGAAVGGVEQVVRETEDVVRKLTVPLAPAALAAWVKGLAECAGADGIKVDSRWAEMATDDENGTQVRVWYESGAITDATLAGQIGSVTPVRMIGRDPTCLFVTREGWRAFLRAGHQLLVLERLPLLGVVVNPVSPFGDRLDRHLLRERMQAKLNVPVWDVMDRESADAMDG